jgi:hypothetical protein
MRTDEKSVQENRGEIVSGRSSQAMKYGGAVVV